MSEGRPDAAVIISLLRERELLDNGLPRPEDAPPARWPRKAVHRGWVLLPRLGALMGRDAASLGAAAAASPLLRVATAEPPRFLGLFRRRPVPAATWEDMSKVSARVMADPLGVAPAVLVHPAAISTFLPQFIAARGATLPLRPEAPPEAQRIVVPGRSRESLLQRVDPGLVDLYAREDLALTRKRRAPEAPLRFPEGYPARDLPSAVRLLVSARAASVAERLRSGALAEWFREEAGEAELAAVIDAAAHAAQDRGEGDEAARARLLQYIRRTAVGVELERQLVEPLAEGVRSRDPARVAQSARALLLLDPDLAASELSQALFETDPGCRAPVVEALGATASPRAVDSLERLAHAGTRAEDREGALASLRRLAKEGAAAPVAMAALERLKKA